MRNKVELLSPVGSKEALLAAISNGADAVYLGGKDFSARKYASNFDRDELREAIQLAHLHNVKVYVTVNTILHDQELTRVLDYISYLYKINVDALIVQDLALVYLIRKYFPDFPIHGSTQMTVNDLNGALFLEKLGFKRVVLSRETPLSEIEHIKNNSNIELETFIHGALCVSYSGQCLMSSLIGGRSGNRGNCAQPCRKKYRILDRDKNFLIHKGEESLYYLSPKDLYSLDNLDSLISAGVSSLKIEGRMKRPEYVATVVSKYRKKLDGKSISSKDKKEVKEIFNRGFTEGLGFGAFSRSFLNPTNPKNKGLYVGDVEEKFGLYFINLCEDLSESDVLKVETKSSFEIINIEKDYSKGEKIKLDSKKYKENTKVYRTSNKILLDKAEKSYVNRELNKYLLDMELILKKASNPVLIGRLNGKSFQVKTDFLIEEARKAPIKEEDLIKQMDRLKETPYKLNKLDISMDENIFILVSELNKLRRLLIEELDEFILNKGFEKRNRDLNLNKDIFKDITKLESNKKALSIYVGSYDLFERIDLEKLDRLYIGYYDKLAETFEKLDGVNGLEVYLWPRKINYSKDYLELEDILKIYSSKLDGVVANNLGMLNYITSNYSKLNIHGGEGLNIYNSLSANLLKNADLGSLALSYELRLDQIKKIKKSNIFESLGYGYIKVMTNKACPFSLIKNCRDSRACSSCEFRDGYYLEDPIGARFPLKRTGGNTLIYNSVPLHSLDFIGEIYDSHIDFLRLDFNFSWEEVEEIQNIYYKKINNQLSSSELKEFLSKFQESGMTKGHYFRGVASE